MNESDEHVWQGLRRHLDDVGNVARPPEFVRVRERSGRRQRPAGRALAVLWAAGITLVAVIVVPQWAFRREAAAPGSSSGATDASGATQAELRHAQAALERWAQVANAEGTTVVITASGTGQIGDWEPGVGDNNKVALNSGAIVAPAGISNVAPPPGQVQWADGTSRSVALLSAGTALDDIILEAGIKCTACQPIQITTVALGTANVATSRGPATVPVWEFGVAGSTVKVTRVAVAALVTVPALAWDSSDGPEGISIGSAVGAPESTQLTVSFGGAPIDAPGACGADYTAQAAESDLAIVVMVIEHAHALSADPSVTTVCDLMAGPRTVAVTLASPLATRAVLEARDGLPVPVTTP